MAYPYTEEDYAKLLRKAAQETRDAMKFSEMMDDVRPDKRPPIRNRAVVILSAMRKTKAPLTVSEIADVSNTVCLKTVKRAVAKMLETGEIVRTDVLKDRRGGGAPVVTYAPVEARHG